MTNKKVSIELSSKIGIVYSQTDCLAKEPLFIVHRFSVRRIELISNSFNNYSHSYLITGDMPDETIIICFLQNIKGIIYNIKCCRSIKMDKELGSYIIKAIVNRFKINYDFEYNDTNDL